VIPLRILSPRQTQNFDPAIATVSGLSGTVDPAYTATSSVNCVAAPNFLTPLGLQHCCNLKMG
jgi:hypothetical protein